MSQLQVVSGEINSPIPVVTKTIKVRRKKAASVAGGGVGGGVGGGIDAFDAFLAKSGLESKTYQREGVEFCLRRENDRSGVVLGGIIADEMGLGKTIVMIGLILANLVAIRRTLIVVPVALIAQWVAQLKKNVIDSGFKPDLTIAVYHGASRRRIICCDGKWHLMPDRRSSRSRGVGDGSDRPIDIVITTYGSVALEVPASENSNAAKKPKRSAAAAKHRLSLLTFGAERVIFDEAHHMRNKKNRIFRGAMKLLGRCGSGYDRSGDGGDGNGGDGNGGDGNGGDGNGGDGNGSKVRVWNVTGTPIQNKISDLKSLCYILGFSPAEVIRSEQREVIRDNYVLRRTKMSVGMIAAPGSAVVAGATGGADVAAPALKSLEHSSSNVSWGNENELQLSREIHMRARNTTNRTERLKLYTRMRQMCVWPALISSSAPVASGKPSADSDADATAAADAGVDTYDLPVEQYKNALSHQSKLNRVVDIITQELAADPTRKSIVFCHFRREMTRIRELLLAPSGVGVGIEIIDGSVSGTQRNRILAASPQILLLQIRTCSEGLNLQAYTDVYFVSPHWNPCVEDQAIARCFRMGQLAQVRVFRFYMTDFVVDELSASVGDDGELGGGAGDGSGASSNISTLDHKCEETQERKRALCNEFLEGGGGGGGYVA